jgi:hypothetical protein
MRQLPSWGDSSSSLPHITPSLAMLHGNQQHSMAAEQGFNSSSYALASLSNSSNIWNAAASMAPNMHLHVGDGAMLQQQLGSAAAAAAEMHSASGSLLQLPPVSAAAAAATAAATAPFYSTSTLWPSKERDAGLFFSAEHAFDNSACSGSFASAAAAAAAAAASAFHSSGNLPQVSCSNNSGTLPSLLEVIPAMSWLQLQQLERQDAFNAAAAAAAGGVGSSSGAVVAGEPTGMSSGSLVGSNSRSNTGMAARGMAGQAAAALQEVELELNPQAASVLVGSLDFVKRRSGADVSVVCGAMGLQLKLCGATHQIEGACAILRMLLL